MKTLNSILNKYGITGLGIQQSKRTTCSKNNASREEFKSFCSEHGFTSIGFTNSFFFNGKIYGFSKPSTNKAECRQFAEHYEGLVCKLPSGTVKWFDKSQLVIGSCTRIGPDGVKYFNTYEKM